MNLSYKKYDLQLRHRFAIANYSRNMTPVVLTELEHKGIVGYGEAALPQYLGETQESVCRFLSKVKLDGFEKLDIERIMGYVDKVEAGNTAAKAAVDIALHDLKGKMEGVSVHELWGIKVDKMPFTSYTIGIDTEEVIREKVAEAEPYAILKIKVDRDGWRRSVDFIRSLTEKPLYVDANQSWQNKEEALESVEYLKGMGVQLVEQPLPKGDLDGHHWLTERSPLPIIADESIQRLSDMERIRGAFSGINIKLMKCTGLNEAHKLVMRAREYGMLVMLGCMTETSCGISAAAQLAPLADFVDLDGNLLIANDCFDGVKVVKGRLQLRGEAGIGVIKCD